VDAIRIRHCRLRVLRHGGWSWGADPRRLVEQVTQRLPAWLAEALAGQLADCPPDLVIPRLCLRIPIRMSELRDWPPNDAERGGDALAGALAQRVRTLLAAALQDIPRVPSVSGTQPAAVEAQRPAIDEISATAVLDALTAWQRADDLPRMLAAVDVATLRVWARVMLEELAAAGNFRESPADNFALLVERLEVLLNEPGASDASLAQALVRIVVARGAPHPDTAADRVVDGVESGPPPAAMADGARGDRPPARLQLLDEHPAVMRRRAPPARQARREPVVVESVLPFIVMGILSRLNYFEGLRAALVCSDQLERSDCFAAAIAYKVSPPPNRGWDRSPATRRVAAAMSGRDEPPDNATMDSFLRGLSTACPPLDAALWPANRATHRQPGILVEKLDGGSWAALDIASSRPLGWFASLEAVLRLADLLPGRLWWLAAGAADSDLPEALARRSLRAVALGVQPRVTGWLSAGESLSTNEPLLRRRAAELRRVFDDALELLSVTHSEFVELRPLVLPARGPERRAAEFSITLAVCAALGELADTLWRGREPTQPLLALRRFGDLGGTVGVEEGRVLVRPALGRRFMDLREHGLLRDITGVPWWPGRRVEFAGI
jgi:hypothetical protein